MRKFLLTLAVLCGTVGAWAGPTDLPEITTDANNPVWYTIKNVRKAKYATYAGDSQSMTQQNAVEEGSLFYFTGSINDNVATVKIHNKLAGEKLCAATNSWTADGIDWYISAKTQTGLSISKTDDFSGNNSWNDFQGKGQTLDYWSATDPGSIWVISKVENVVLQNNETFSTTWYASTWDNCDNVPTDVADVESKKYPDNTSSVKFYSMSVNVPEGYLNATLTYVGGSNRLDIVGADLLNADGSVAAADYHFGYTGNSKENNVYRLKVPTAGTYTIRYWVTFCKESNTSNGTIALAHSDGIALSSVNELSNAKAYYLRTSRGALVYNLENDQHLCSTKAYSIDNTSDAAKWVIYKHTNNKYYLYSLAGDVFVGQATGEGERFPLTALPTYDVQIVSSTKEGYPFVFSTDNFGAINHFNHTTAPGVANWRGNGSQGGIKALDDDGCAHQIIETADLTEEQIARIAEKFNAMNMVKVVYRFMYNDEEIYTQETANVVVGAGYPDVSISLPYGVSAQKPEGQVEKESENDEIITKEVQLTISKALPFETAESADAITNWYYMRMHTNQPGYVGDIAEDYTINVAQNKAVATDAIDNYVWGFVGDVFTGITVVNKGTNLQLTSTGSGNVTLTNNGTSFFIVATTETSENAINGFCLRKKESNQFMNAHYSLGKLNHWSSTDAGSTFFLTEYIETDVTVSAAEYSTLYLGYTSYIPEGVEVYTITNVANGYATMTQIEGVLPANTGVILKNAGDYKFKLSAGVTGSAEGNLLQGSVENTYIEGPAYVLSNGTNGIGLYKALLNKNEEGTEGDTHFLNNAGKAYLPAPAEAPTRFLVFNFGGEETGIDEPKGENSNVKAVVYDLAGRRVQNAQKGVFIVNGKVVIK
ncbi:MAG: hypothetical protein J6S07_09120 [Bacteroidaceae bacterium]|nr:hypothetical protein [Bacteroidaceae bacterium]